MDCILTVTLADGQEVVLTTEDILTPDYTNGCFTPEEFVERVSEYGVITQELDGNGNIVTNKISPHCICNINFVSACDNQ